MWWAKYEYDYKNAVLKSCHPRRGLYYHLLNIPAPTPVTFNCQQQNAPSRLKLLDDLPVCSFVGYGTYLEIFVSFNRSKPQSEGSGNAQSQLSPEILVTIGRGTLLGDRPQG